MKNLIRLSPIMMRDLCDGGIVLLCSSDSIVAKRFKQRVILN